MKGIIKGSLVTGLLAMCLMSNVYATDSNKIINKTLSNSKVVHTIFIKFFKIQHF